ncbi:MAG: hypothetical protein ACRD68_17410, partial [Pyrinomonadaceae bacterium]
MNRVLLGALVGLAATGPMTLAMKAMHEMLPPDEQHPLPPRRVAMELAEDVGLKERLDEPEREAVTVLSHFAYGAASGAVYAPLARSLPLPPVVSGAAFGLA